MGPEGGVGGVLALHGVVADNLEDELVVVDEHVGGEGEGGFQEGAVFA